MIVREGILVMVKFRQHLNVGKFWTCNRKKGRIKAVFLNIWEKEDIRVCLDGLREDLRIKHTPTRKESYART